MKKLYFLILFAHFLASQETHAQCTNTVIDWDYREFFGQHNSALTNYVSLAQSQTQHYAFGANKLTITHNYSGNNVAGDNNSHTGDGSSYGTGADIQFTGNGAIGFAFQTAVTNLKFSLYDVDRSQVVTITALNGVTSIPVVMAKVSGSVLSVSGSGTNTAVGTATNTTVASSSSDGTLNVDIAGPVTAVTITVTNTGTCGAFCGTGGSESGNFWISDITACSSGSFPNGYQAVSTPFAGQPYYTIAVVDNKFYYIDPVSGVAKFIFMDNTHTNMNSLAYDPYNRYIYYTYSLSGSGSSGVDPNQKSLRRYDMNMDTFGIALANVNHLGIPTFGQGVESGAAAFYNGNLYWGIEGNQSTYVESIIWRIEFNGSQFPIGFSQLYAQETYSGSGNRQHDWADFMIDNGTLYDFDGGYNGTSGTNTDFYHQNLLTGAVTRYVPVAGLVPRQVAVDYQSRIYNIGAVNNTTGGFLQLYNGTTGVGTPVNITYKGAPLMGSWGDAAEAFRPHCDFGDAPASYDPNPNSPAVNERDTALRLGNQIDIEWLTRGQNALANADNYDDGIGTVTILNNLSSNYYVQVSVHNNTGSNATMIGWLDYNANGVFDAGEASAVATVPTSPTNQNVNLSWTGITGISPTLTPGSYTYLRVRITTGSMNANHATGWFGDGETEDYRVLVESNVLPIQLLSFEAKAQNNSSVRLQWTAIEDVAVESYEVQRSYNGREWEYFSTVNARGTAGTQLYELIDIKPFKGTTRYRLKIHQRNAEARYSDIRSVKITDLESLVTLSPNPATSRTVLTVSSEVTGEIAQVRIVDTKGQEYFFRKLRLTAGNNDIALPLESAWQAGTYLVVVTTDQGTVTKKLLINK